MVGHSKNNSVLNIFGSFTKTKAIFLTDITKGYKFNL